MEKLLRLLLATAIIAGSTATDTCCVRLRERLGARISYPGQLDYNATEASYWSLQESNLQPACILRPSSAEDVAQAVSIITATDGCNFAVKGQGHAPAAGFANIDSGVTIDMTSLNTSKVACGGSVVKVDAGAAWLSVYQYLDLYGLAVAGGRNGLVGAGGLLVGGGISHFSPRVGWACDGVVNFEVVLANGTVTNANEKENPDLYRALKGGGNNFGVVTRFDLATFPQGNLSVTTLAHDISVRDQVFKAFTDITNAPRFDVYTSLVTGFLFTAATKTWTLSNSAVYTKPNLHPQVFAELSAVPSLSNSTTLTSLAELAKENPTPALNWLFETATFAASATLMSELFDVLNSSLYSFAPAGGVTWSIAFEPLPSVMLSYAKDRGGNALGLQDDGQNSFVVLVSALWPDSASNSAVSQVARDSISAMESHAEERGLLRNFQYLNYAGPDQNPLESYGATSLEFLRETSAIYDPPGIFQDRVTGGFKL